MILITSIYDMNQKILTNKKQNQKTKKKQKKKRLLPKFQLIPILLLLIQVIHEA